jgi:hypothetical protein
MNRNICHLLLLFSLFGVAQKNETISNKSYFIIPEVFVGKTHPANNGFPELELNKGVSIHLGTSQENNAQEWAYRLRYPKTGIAFTFTDYGNNKYVGYSFSLMPFLEYGLFKKKFNEQLKMNIGLGSSYFTQEYNGTTYSYNNIIDNNNRAISTRFTWAFKAFLYYDVLNERKASLEIRSWFSSSVKWPYKFT